MLKKTSKIFLLVSDPNTATNTGSQAAITQIRRAKSLISPVCSSLDLRKQWYCPSTPRMWGSSTLTPAHGFPPFLYLHAFLHRQGEQTLAPRRMDISPHYASVYWPTQVSSPYYSALETHHSESTRDFLICRCEVHSSWKRLWSYGVLLVVAAVTPHWCVLCRLEMWGYSLRSADLNIPGITRIEWLRFLPVSHILPPVRLQMVQITLHYFRNYSPSKAFSVTHSAAKGALHF